MRWKYRLHPARALLWLVARLYRTKDEQLGRMLIDLGRMYLRRPDEIGPDTRCCVELIKLGSLEIALTHFRNEMIHYVVDHRDGIFGLGVWYTAKDEHRRVFRRPRQ